METKLRQARKQRGLSQTALAETAGVPQQWISAYELGKAQPTQPAAARIGKVLGLAPGELAMPSDGGEDDSG